MAESNHRLWCSRTPPPGKNAAPARARFAQESGDVKNQPKILILDEDPTVADAAVRGLRAACSHWDVLAIRTAREALDTVIREPVAVLVVPAADRGVDLLAQARRLSPETMAIATMEVADPQTLLECVNIAGVFRCVVTPVSAGTLASHIADAIDEHLRRRVLLDLIHSSVAGLSRPADAMSGS